MTLCLRNRAVGLVELGRLEEALVDTEKAESILQEHGAAGMLAETLAYRAVVEFAVGRYEGAIDACDRALNALDGRDPGETDQRQLDFPVSDN